MKRKLFLPVVISLFAFLSVRAADQNFSGWGDSTVFYVTGTTTAASKAFNLSPYEKVAVVLKMQDTARVGTTDSIHAVWGWQVGMLTGKADTTWNVPMSCDSVNITKGYLQYNSSKQSVSAVAGVALLGYVDTLKSGTTHVFKQVRTVAPEWGVVWRFWVTGKAFNSSAHGVKFWFTPIGRDHLNIKTN